MSIGKHLALPLGAIALVGAVAIVAAIIFGLRAVGEPSFARTLPSAIVSGSGGSFTIYYFLLSTYYSPMLTQKIRSDMTAAMKARDALRVETLRGALAAFTNELVAKGRKPTKELDDKDAITVLKRLAKQRKEAAEQYEKGGRAELAQKEAAELKIIEAYLPQMASREEIQKVAEAKKAELGITDASGLGKLTGAVMKELAGNADGNDVKEVVGKLFE